MGAAGSSSGGVGGSAGAAGSATGGGGAGTAGSATGGGGAGGSATGGGGAGGSAAGGGGAGGGATGGGGAGGAGGSGGSAGGPAVTPDCGTKFKAVVTGNHGHVLMIPMADVMAGTTKAYNAQGTSNHPHWVELTTADFTKLKAGGTVRKLSCDDGHEHEYIINCVGNDMLPETSQKAMYCDAGHMCGLQNNYCQTLPDS